MICGIDLGSRQVKLVLLENDSIAKKELFNTITFYKEKTRHDAKAICIERERLDIPKGAELIITGYGKNNLGLKNTSQITEVKAQVWGAIFQTGYRDFSLLDIGGQDIKVIQVRAGRVINILMNDKCAAGSGRYLEGMAGILGVGLNEIGEYYEEPVVLDSACAIYGESELIGKLAEGYSIPRLCAGVNLALCKRIIPMLSDLSTGERLFCSGGVAQNRAIIHLLNERSYHAETLNDPVFNGSIGCASWGIRGLNEKY